MAGKTRTNAGFDLWGYNIDSVVSYWCLTVAIVYLSIPCMLFTSALITYTLSNMEAVKATIFGNLSLLIAIFAAIIVRDEPFFMYQFICTALILIGVIGTNVSEMKSKN